MFKVYDHDKNLVDLNDLNSKGAKITAIMQCNFVWVADKSFGVTWKVVQLRVISKPRILDYMFRDDMDRIFMPLEEKKGDSGEDENEKKSMI